MVVKKIFIKKNNNKNIYIFFIFFIFFVFICYFVFLNKKTNFVIVPADDSVFYIVPVDKGGEKVKNLEKKSLNLNLEQKFIKFFNQPDDVYFSIQFYTHSELDIISKYLKKINKGEESIYNLKDFFIMALNSDIGTEYFLLYKSFETRKLAKNYCINYLSKLDKCLIVDTTKF